MKKETTNYYEDIMEGFRRLDSSGRSVRNADKLFVCCQQYYWHYKIREKMKTAERVLQNYYNENDYMAKRKLKQDSCVKPRYGLKDKLYLEFRYEIYSRFYQEKEEFDDFVNSNTFSEDISMCFQTEPIKLVEYLTDIWHYANCDPDFVSTWYNKHDCQYIHEAMENVREALNIELPPVDVSVEAVISEEWLERMLDYLNNDNFPGAFFAVTAISRPLHEGIYHKYIKGNNQVFFNINSEYNLQELQDRVDATRELLDRYDSIMKELDGYRRQFK